MEDGQKKLILSIPAGLAGAVLLGLFVLFMFTCFEYSLTLPQGILLVIVMAGAPVCLEGLLGNVVHCLMMDTIMIIGSFLLTVLYALQAGGNTYTVQSILQSSGLLHALVLLFLIVRMIFDRRKGKA